MKTRGIVGLSVIVWVLIGAAIGISAGKEIRDYRQFIHEVTWYSAGTITSTGEVYDPTAMTCAVRDRSLIGHKFAMQKGEVVIFVRANDLMPPKSKADFDLTPAAFLKLAPLSKGRLKGVYVRKVE